MQNAIEEKLLGIIDKLKQYFEGKREIEKEFMSFLLEIL